MSLTSELDNPRSPVAHLVDFIGTVVSGAKRGALFGEELQRLLGLDGVPRQAAVSPIVGANPGTVGTAFDYRLRYHLAPCDPREFVAWHGARELTTSAPTLDKLLSAERLAPNVAWFFDNLQELTAELAPAGKQLGAEEEELLARYCVTLALFESVFRSPWRPELPPMSHTKRTPPGDEPLLALATDACARDVVNLSRSAERVFSPVIDLVTVKNAPYHPNPTFAGSPDVGGADADFIVGYVVYEVKTTKNPEPRAVRNALRQLLGYVLLDYDDRYCIRGIGLYFPRQEWAGERPLWHILFPPATVVRHLSQGSEPSEDEIVTRLVKARRLMRRAAKGEEIDYEAEFA